MAVPCDMTTWSFSVGERIISNSGGSSNGTVRGLGPDGEVMVNFDGAFYNGESVVLTYTPTLDDPDDDEGRNAFPTSELAKTKGSLQGYSVGDRVLDDEGEPSTIAGITCQGTLLLRQDGDKNLGEFDPADVSPGDDAASADGFAVGEWVIVRRDCASVCADERDESCRACRRDSHDGFATVTGVKPIAIVRADGSESEPSRPSALAHTAGAREGIAVGARVAADGKDGTVVGVSDRLGDEGWVEVAIDGDDGGPRGYRKAQVTLASAR